MDRDEALTALREDSIERQRRAARSLWEASRTSSGELEEALEELRAATTHEDPLVRGHAVAALGETLFGIHDHDAPVPELDAVLARLTDANEGVRQTVTGLLRNRSWWPEAGDGADHPITDGQRKLAAVGLVACLDDPVFLTRRRAVSELWPSLVLDHPDPERATAAVAGALTDEGATTRSGAAELLGGLAELEPSLLEPHVETLRRAMEEDDAVRSEAAAAVRPVLEECAADLSGDDEDRRNRAAWLLGQVALERPAEGRRYEPAMRSAVDRPEEFDDFAHRKLRTGLAELGDDDAEGPGSDDGDADDSADDDDSGATSGSESGGDDGGDGHDDDDRTPGAGQRTLREFQEP